MRVLCLFFPRLAIQLVRRARPDLAGRPLVLIHGVGAGARVVATSSEAVAAGVLCGMDASQARRRCPDAAYLASNPGEALAEMERLAAVLRLRVTPHVEAGGRDHLFLDLEGLPAASPAGPEEAERIARVAAMWLGVEARAGVGTTRAAALEAARAARGLRAVVASETADRPERPIRDASADVVTGEAPVVAPHDPRAVVERVLARLGVMLEGRAQGFRTLRLDAGGPDWERSYVLRAAAPVATAASADALLHVLPGAALEGARHVRITCSGLGPVGSTRLTPALASMSSGRDLRFRRVA